MSSVEPIERDDRKVTLRGSPGQVFGVEGHCLVINIIVIVLVKELGKSVLFWIIRLPLTLRNSIGITI